MGRYQIAATLPEVNIQLSKTRSLIMILTPIRLCSVVAVVCGLWNLFGDLYFMDFYLAHMNFEGFGTIDTVSRPGHLFDLRREWTLQLAQAGGWMYPIWAVVTAYPLYVGIRSMVPCVLMAYGLCVVGGALHSGFAFATILPKVMHTPSREISHHGELDCYPIMQVAQKKLMESYVFGYTPGPMAIAIASVWVGHIVITKQTMFPKWFVLCTPLMTVVWVTAVGLALMPEPFGIYFAGTFGTWIILVMNVAAAWVLWNIEDEKALKHARIKSN